MAIYGTALLSACLLLGISLGRVLGMLLGIDADIGGVGIAMLLLIWVTEWMHRTGRLKPSTELGITFWGVLYIPIVIAMAASQNVVAAFKGGAIAFLAGLFVVIISFALVGILVRISTADQNEIL